MTIKAIETQYRGYRFRSRLEARWAIFFDALKCGWEYEKEGFDLGELGWYLPDFWLSDQRVWVEIKGQVPTENEVKKMQSITAQTDCRYSVMCGNVDPRAPVFMFFGKMTILRAIWGVSYNGSLEAYWSPSETVDFDPVLIPLARITIDAYNNSLLDVAYRAAHSARFEHGESPFHRYSR